MTDVDLTALIKEHDWDELIFGGYLCLTCTPDGDTDATAWPCPPLRAAGMTDAHAIAVIENRRLRVGWDAARVEVERLRGQVEGRNEAIAYNNREADRLRRYVSELEEQCDKQLAEIKQLRTGAEGIIDSYILVGKYADGVGDHDVVQTCQTVVERIRRDILGGAS